MDKQCQSCQEVKKIYAKGFCRNCYRRNSGDYSSTWKRIKSDPIKLEAHRKRVREYGKIRGQTEEYKEKRRIYLREKYALDPKYRERIKNWKKNLPLEKKRENYIKDNNTKYFGTWLMVDRVMKKYNYGCAMCGMTNDEHEEKYKSRLSLHHRDGNGRSVPRRIKNNDEDNLVPLCKSCHQKVEIRKIDI